MKDEELKCTAKLYGDLNDIHYTKIKALEDRVYELERSIDLIYHILESKQDTNEL